jgi:regulator of nonsense transcripts 1
MNAKEGALCVAVVELLLKSGVKPEQIGVVTPYEGQCIHIIGLFNLIIKKHTEKSSTIKNDKAVAPKSPYEDVQVASVNAFQGRGKDYIIFSCVRSNDGIGIGFLNDPRRLNVALTRPKYGLSLVGNPDSLRVDPLWSRLVNHHQSNGFMMDITRLRATAANPIAA